MNENRMINLLRNTSGRVYEVGDGRVVAIEETPVEYIVRLVNGGFLRVHKKRVAELHPAPSGGQG